MQSFDEIPFTGNGGYAITGKIQNDQRRPNLSTEQNQIGGCTTRPPGKHPRQVSKKSDQWSRRRCDNEKLSSAVRTYGRTDPG